jgi:GT2 family glycosyltransferase
MVSDRSSIDVLMVTCDRPEYTRRSLRRLLESGDETMRVWVWHNGNDAATLAVVRSMQDHPRFHRFHHSPRNRLLRVPINWLFENARGELVSLVNDDCLVSEGWAHTLRQAHEDVAELGVVACWHFQTEDFIPRLAEKKVRAFAGGHRLMVNPWVQGSGIMLKRRCVGAIGPLPAKDRGMTAYCIRLAAQGWVNGWYLPLVPIDHMDDPRSPHTMLRTNDDLAAHPPLSARFRNTRTIDDWLEHLRRSARMVQEAPADPRLHVGLRKKIRRSWIRLRGKEVLY